MCCLRGITDGLGLGQRQVCLGGGWHWLYRTWGKMLATFRRRHPCSPPLLPKPCHIKPIQGDKISVTNSVFCVHMGKLALLLCVSKKLGRRGCILVKMAIFVFPGLSQNIVSAVSYLVL